jgi:CRISPR-associated protein Csx16
MKTSIITRHAGAIEWLRQRGITGDVLAQATPEQVRGCRVIGILPLHLAAEATEVVAIDMPQLRAEDRGRDLSPAEMDAAGACLRRYQVRAIPDETPAAEPELAVTSWIDRWWPTKMPGGYRVSVGSRATGHASRFIPYAKAREVGVFVAGFNSRTPAAVSGPGVLWSYSDGHGMQVIAILSRGGEAELWMPGHHGHGAGRKYILRCDAAGKISSEELNAEKEI